MLSIFKLVKSVADFPNIIYILGLDLSNTCALLEGKHSGLKGHEYLDKIVQYPINLPHPGEDRLNKLLGNFIETTGGVGAIHCRKELAARYMRSKLNV